MKTKYWILIFFGAFVVCAILSLLLFFPSQAASYAQIWSEGTLIQTVSLQVDGSYVIESSNGSNTVTVEDGTICVSDATCPNHDCMKRGKCSGGRDIICLPNQLVIKFITADAPDAVTG